VMSRTVDLHPLSIAFVLLVMGALFGLLGALLAVPSALIIKTLYQELYQSRQEIAVGALEAQSERLISERATVEATAEAQEGSGRGRGRASRRPCPPRGSAGGEPPETPRAAGDASRGLQTPPAWTRTRNLVVNSHPLCRLSYRGMPISRVPPARTPPRVYQSG